MKPTIKSSIPLKSLRFCAALFLFIGVCAGFSAHMARQRDAGQYRCSVAKISPDGQVTYLATREEAGDPYATWEFDETLQHPRRRGSINVVEITPNSMTVQVALFNIKNVERISRAVLSISGGTYQRYLSTAKGPVFWWNGPAGQVDWYDGVSRMREASLGPAYPAVKAPARPKDRFDALRSAGVAPYVPYIVTPQGIYVLSLALPDLSANLVYKGSCQGFGQGFGQGLESRSETRSPSARLLVVHDNTLSVLDAAGSLLRDIKLPEIVPALLNEHFSSSFTLFDNGKVAIDGYRKIWNKKTILLLAEDGSLVRHVDYDTNEISKALNGGMGRTAEVLFPTLMPPIPVPGFMEKSALIQSIALSLVLAAVVLWRQTRLGRRGAWRVAWVVFTLVFGLLGFVTYLAAYRDRRSEPCPNCRRRRPVAEDICPHCGAPWPAPKPLGIEIVETA